MNKGDALETTQISLTITLKMKADLETERQKTYKRSLQEFIIDVLSDFLEHRRSDLPDSFVMEKKKEETEK
jgi:hypothetical protein